jgi:hypothetical protein
MEKPKRSYYLPGKLVTAFDRECSKSGYVKEKVVAAAMLSFLEGSPEFRNNMFERLDVFLRGKRTSETPVRASAATVTPLRPAKPKKAKAIKPTDDLARTAASR